MDKGIVVGSEDFALENDSTLPIRISSMLHFWITLKLNAASVAVILIAALLGFSSDRSSEGEQC